MNKRFTEEQFTQAMRDAVAERDRMSTAHSLSRFYRVIGTEGRISGTWVAMLPVHSDKATLIFPHEVTIYDEGRHSGRTLGSKDFTAWVYSGDHVELPHHMIRESVRPDVLEVWDELIELLPLIGAAAKSEGSETE